ncbi:hypothetical protein Mmc1_3313 [Magnetococcus marinus MC-1]|uniref:N-acetyltransferase domain-containing protein n=1 Tax=Magnetococcus marinus (strain ATCC BAA-1437 / JCM 17883 / MC-1) TaxID=156889 RepID=A0LCV9_MAGMM|nr:GNAT family N-acetyltransferase [Magnetococcus marinus]ABK45802.1 hypothetical protein Mmc1_3313 [Magnetococcus marinus MC-1]
MPDIHPILDADLPAAAHFLHTHMNPNLSTTQWCQAFQHGWLPDRPNHGFMLVDKGEIVGLFMAVYGQRLIRGTLARFCNPNSWVVLPAYRGNYSRLLMRALLEQPDFHFFITTPNPVVTKLFERAHFTTMDARLSLLPCLPGLPLPRQAILTDLDAIEASLDAANGAIVRDHRGLPWLKWVVVGPPQQACLVLYKTRIFKKLPSARILYLSNTTHFLAQRWVLGRYLLLRHGMATMQVDTRFFPTPPPLSYTLIDRQPKLYSSPTLEGADFGYIYSESVALDQ